MSYMITKDVKALTDVIQKSIVALSIPLGEVLLDQNLYIR